MANFPTKDAADTIVYVKTSGSGTNGDPYVPDNSLPPGAATSAKQPAPSVAGTPSADVITVQGAPAMIAIKVDGSGVTQPVSISSIALPAGAAQDGTDITTPTAMPAGGAGIRGWLSAIWTKLNGSLAVTGAFFPATQPVSAASLPLPAGAATEAGHLATIDTSTAKIPAQGQALAAASMPVVLTAIQQTALTPPAAITGFALDATLTGGTQKTIARGGAKGTTAAADLTSNPVDANTQALHVDGSKVTQPVSIATMPTTPVTGTFFQGTQPVSLASVPSHPVTGALTNNNAAPGATNQGALTVLANAANPSLTEGNQVLISSDLLGSLRTTLRPTAALGMYRVGIVTGQYTGIAALGPLFSMRWTDASKLCLVWRITVQVLQIAAATVAGPVDRQLIFARSFTVADSGGTAIVLTGNNQKTRTSMATSIMGDMRITANSALTAGTRTLDAQGIGIASGELTTAALSTGTNSVAIPWCDLFNARAEGDQPLVLAQNEGLIVRMLSAQPTSATMMTYLNVYWSEVNNF